ncbi:hypothetical protein [Kitasatospora viridis]|uniref:Uncharacterized protein n=1 Tax=Kitasatospora viridis TaxID=281105 RepID=A0A561T7I9_9ACTN|nr:hypothetical protein [Kitasatospora viridis]TWF83076.1 hypothetical protein FHX73_14559 [Kitasatospora viridis]
MTVRHCGRRAHPARRRCTRYRPTLPTAPLQPPQPPPRARHRPAAVDLVLFTVVGAAAVFHLFLG